MLRIGIDLGGTKTEITCLDDNRQERYRKRVSSPQGDYQATIATIASLVAEAEVNVGAIGTVGVGIPGCISQPSEHVPQDMLCVKNSNSIWINGRPLLHDLQLALRRELRMENDANCFTLSESMDGAAADASSVFGVIIGTGCGGGLLVNGNIISGHSGLGGEWGHNPLPFALPFTDGNEASSAAFFDRSGQPQQSSIYQHKQKPSYFSNTLEGSEFPGPLCYCGKRGCLETWISGTGFENDYWRVNSEQPLSEKHPEKLSAKAIVAQAEAGEPAAMEAVDRYCERLAKSLAQVVNIIDPEVIVLGGGMSNAPCLYEQVPQRWDKYIFSDRSVAQLLPAHHGDSSGVRGAAFLWDESRVLR
jgi:fructokinase